MLIVQLLYKKKFNDSWKSSKRRRQTGSSLVEKYKAMEETARHTVTLQFYEILHKLLGSKKNYIKCLIQC